MALIIGISDYSQSGLDSFEQPKNDAEEFNKMCLYYLNVKK